MERRSWPWKKKSSDRADKVAAATSSESIGASLSSAGSQDDRDKYKKPTYVQISVESYTHLSGLEEQMKMYEEQLQSSGDQIGELKKKLSTADSEMTAKDSLVKQHAKVAEEAVSGWEKAEAEALALKNHLESVTLMKLTAEDRVAHLDGALKECMRQIRNLKEDHEKKLHDVVFSKTMQWDKIRLELEAKIEDLEQESLRSSAENAALSRSLQDRSNMLIKMNEEKSQTEVESELLKGNLESCERECNSLKYELHIISKELEIRNEEKNMSMRSAEVANRQHLDGVKKIAKLEAECQRLRGLVRKKLPGPAALAQMKLEVENMGRDYGENRQKRSSRPPSPNMSPLPSPHFSPLPEFSLDNVQKCHKDNGFLAERLSAVEEETKMLKEVLAKRNSELQASKDMHAKTVSKLQSLESQMLISSQPKTLPKSRNASNPPSLTSMSEDCNDDDEASCTESWATESISGLSHIKKEKCVKTTKAEIVNRLELMDDFLEMEKLACQSNDSDRPLLISDSSTDKKTDGEDVQAERGKDPDRLANQVSTDRPPLLELQSRMSTVLESISKESDMKKVLVDIKLVMQNAHDEFHRHSGNCILEELHCADTMNDRQACPEDAGVTTEKEISSPLEKAEPMNQDLASALSRIHDFVLFLGKEATTVQESSLDGCDLIRQIDDFSSSFDNLTYNTSPGLFKFVLDLSRVLSRTSELRFNVLAYKVPEGEANSLDCIDKIALPENKALLDSPREKYPNGCSPISDSVSNLDIPHEGVLIPEYEKSYNRSCKCEEFEQLKSEKQKLAMDFVKCSEDLEITKSRLQETEKLLAEVKAELGSAQRSNNLAETQLKCMAESYRSLESRAEDLESELNALLAKTGTLENELQQEKESHQISTERCKGLQEELLWYKREADETDLKAKQEKELTAAAEKLAECQENIFLLGRQLKALCPSPNSNIRRKSEASSEEAQTTLAINSQELDQEEMETTAGSADLPVEPTADPYSSTWSPPSPAGSKHSKHRSSKSGSSSSSTPTPEKQSRGFSRFFSSKGKY